MCDMSHVHVRVYAWHDSYIRVTWLTYTRDMTFLHTWLTHSCIHVKWLMYMCDMTHIYVWPNWYSHVIWPFHTCGSLMYTCDTTNVYAWYDSYTRVTWLIYTRDMTLSHKWLTPVHMWHVSYLRVTWLIHTCKTTHLTMHIQSMSTHVSLSLSHTHHY